MTIPRALVGAVMCMARPARPHSEIAAVLAAATSLQLGSRKKSAQGLARSIAKRVVMELLMEVATEANDPLVQALHRLNQCPFVTLATCAEADTLWEFVRRRVDRLIARNGRYLTQFEQDRECREITAEIEGLLTQRYARHLRRHAHSSTG